MQLSDLQDPNTQKLQDDWVQIKKNSEHSIPQIKSLRDQIDAIRMLSLLDASQDDFDFLNPPFQSKENQNKWEELCHQENINFKNSDSLVREKVKYILQEIFLYKNRSFDFKDINKMKLLVSEFELEKMRQVCAKKEHIFRLLMRHKKHEVEKLPRQKIRDILNKVDVI